MHPQVAEPQKQTECEDEPRERENLRPFELRYPVEHDLAQRGHDGQLDHGVHGDGVVAQVHDEDPEELDEHQYEEHLGDDDAEVERLGYEVPRELMKQDISLAVEARREGLKLTADVTTDPETGERTFGRNFDHKAVRGYTEWLPQLACPKKQEDAPSSTKVVIHLGSRADQSLIARVLGEPAEELMDVEWEAFLPRL